jgi:hypothetical protein
MNTDLYKEEKTLLRRRLEFLDLCNELSKQGIDIYNGDDPSVRDLLNKYSDVATHSDVNFAFVQLYWKQHLLDCERSECRACEKMRARGDSTSAKRSR